MYYLGVLHAEMPSPVFTLRLPQKDREALDLMAKVYGAPSSGGFIAEMVGVMCSGDVERVKAFVARIIQKTGEQLTLKLNAALDESVNVSNVGDVKRAIKPRKRRKVERRPRKRGRSK